MRVGVVEVDVCMDKEEYPAVVCVILDKAFDRVIVAGSLWVLPVCRCVLDGCQVVGFVFCDFGSYQLIPYEFG